MDYTLSVAFVVEHPGIVVYAALDREFSEPVLNGLFLWASATDQACRQEEPKSRGGVAKA